MTDLEQQAIAYADAQEWLTKLQEAADELQDLRNTFEPSTIDDPKVLVAIIKRCEETERVARGVKYGSMCNLGMALKAGASK